MRRSFGMFLTARAPVWLLGLLALVRVVRCVRRRRGRTPILQPFIRCD